MKPSPFLQLLRPWKKYKDGTPFYGVAKTGNKRWTLTTKQGNKNYYKGTGSAGVGWWSRRRYMINWEKVRTFVVPSTLENTELRPYVCPTTMDVHNSYSGYQGATDPRLQLRKVMEFVKYGAEDSPDMARRGHKERG